MGIAEAKVRKERRLKAQALNRQHKQPGFDAALEAIGRVASWIFKLIPFMVTFGVLGVLIHFGSSWDDLKVLILVWALFATCVMLFILYLQALCEATVRQLRREAAQRVGENHVISCCDRFF